jgi:CubicO group peptidase (beta-lactamase class C family)
MKKVPFQYFTVVILMLIIHSCSKDNIQRTYQYVLPQQINDGLEISSLDSERIDVGLIEYLIDYINSGKYEYIHSVVIVRNNKLVLEKYFNGYSQSTLNNMYSVTKSFCSALIGIAIDNQYIKSVNDPIKPYLPQYSDIDWAGKENITIQNLLTMSAGLEWDEGSAPYTSTENSHVQMSQSSD